MKKNIEKESNDWCVELARISVITVEEALLLFPLCTILDLPTEKIATALTIVYEYLGVNRDSSAIVLRIFLHQVYKLQFKPRARLPAFLLMKLMVHFEKELKIWFEKEAGKTFEKYILAMMN